MRITRLSTFAGTRAAVAFCALALSGCMADLGLQSSLSGGSNGSFSGITAAQTLSPTSVRVTWNTSNQYSQYEVFSSASTAAAGISIFSSLIVTGLQPATSYSFSVGGVPKSGSSGSLDGIQSSLTEATWPSFTGAASMVASSPYTLQASWNYGVTGTNGPTFKVFVAANGVPTDFTKPVATTQGLLTGIAALADGTPIQPNTLYFAIVRATYLDGTTESNLSAVSATTPSTINPVPTIAVDPVIFSTTPTVTVSNAINANPPQPGYVTKLYNVTGGGSSLIGQVNGNGSYQIPSAHKLSGGQNLLEAIVSYGTDSLTLPTLPVTVRSLSSFFTPPGITGGRGFDRLGMAVAVGDFNCDGYQDLAVAAPDAYAKGDGTRDAGAYGFELPGIVEVFYGSATGLNTTSYQVIKSPLPVTPAGNYLGGHFGGVLAAGNLNGDVNSSINPVHPQCDDLAVATGLGSLGQGWWGSNWVVVYYGSTSGLQDGVPQVNAPTCSGSVCQPTMVGLNGGESKTNPYGWWGPVAGGYTYDQYQPLFGLSIAIGKLHYGTTVPGSGNTCANCHDLIVASPNDNTWVGTQPNHTQLGSIYVFYGDTTGLNFTNLPTLSVPYTKIYAPAVANTTAHAAARAWTSDFGYSITSTDMDGDGIDDLIVGAPFEDSGGGAYVGGGATYFIMSKANSLNTGTPAIFPTAPIASYQRIESPLYPQYSYYYFGSTVYRAGDVNGDGYGDVLISSRSSQDWYWTSGTPVDVLVVYGSAAGPQIGNGCVEAGAVQGTGSTCQTFQTQACTAGTCTMQALMRSTSSDVNNSYTADGLGGAGPSQSGNTLGNEDTNGDGYADVILGFSEAGSPTVAQAQVYLGSVNGLSFSPITLTPQTTSGPPDFGASVALGQFKGAAKKSGGGINIADAVVGEPDLDLTVSVAQPAPLPAVNQVAYQTGAALVFESKGSSGTYSLGSTNTPDLQLSPNATEEYHLDIGLNAGYTYALPVGDLNGDGYTDVAIITENYQFDHHVYPAYAAYRLAIYYGSANGIVLNPPATFSPVHPTDPLLFPSTPMYSLSEINYLGVFPAGDVNGDGYDDLCVWMSNPPDYPGNYAATVYYGSFSGVQTFSRPVLPAAAGGLTPVVVANPNSIHYYTYNAVTRVGNENTSGDFNGDGYSDLAFGTYHGADGGADPVERVTVIYGSKNGPQTDGVVDIAGSQDAYPPGDPRDVAVTQPPCIGTVPTLTCSPQMLVGLTNPEQFGSSVGSAGDVNGDGYEDLLVGAPNHSVTGPGDNNGGAYLFYGGPQGLTHWNGSSSGLLIMPALAKPGEANRYAGGVAQGVGDVNGDGFDDILLAAYYDQENPSYGGGYLLYGCSNGMNNTTPTPGCTDGNPHTGIWGLSSGSGFISDPVVVNAPSCTGGVCQPLFFFLDYNMGGGGGYPYYRWSYFGLTGGAAGDLNNDGYADVVLGTDVNTPYINLPGYNAAWPSYYVYMGAVAIWTGGPNGLNANLPPSKNPTCNAGACNPTVIAVEPTEWGVTKPEIGSIGDFSTFPLLHKKIDFNGDGLADLFVPGKEFVNPTGDIAQSIGFYLFW